mmetsp:Transcript_22026/g.28518  ORF Transcript_22026/g.28518 Transcript_22026/m.28518 type:complete len:130 (+) Transcript_22026:1661-2050(+)
MSNTSILRTRGISIMEIYLSTCDKFDSSTTSPNYDIICMQQIQNKPISPSKQQSLTFNTFLCQKFMWKLWSSLDQIFKCCPDYSVILAQASDDSGYNVLYTYIHIPMCSNQHSDIQGKEPQFQNSWQTI